MLYFIKKLCLKTENVLGLIFDDDYRAYTRNYGAISADGIELTGVTTARRLNKGNPWIYT